MSTTGEQARTVIGGRVLIVDDDPDLLGVLQLALTKRGYEVTVAQDGREALEAVCLAMPQLILLDMRMPGMDGWTFARSFRARYDAEVPIVVMTAAEDARRRAREIEADDCLGKPFDLRRLYEMVARYAGSGGGGAAAGARGSSPGAGPGREPV